MRAAGRLVSIAAAGGALAAILLGLAGCSGGAAEARTAARDTSLARLARELLPAVEEGSGLRAEGPVRLARSGRESLERFVTRELREQLPPERARGVRDAYARLGLLPSDLDLFSLLRDLYLEQVIGYYDPETDTLFVRAGVEGPTLRPVLLHEMVHALQDQAMDLDSLMRAREERNDAAAAARAALEGQATFVMIEWQLRRAAGADSDLTRVPDLGELVSRSSLEGLGASGLSRAPRIVRESLLFPYLEGVTFVQRVWREEAGRPPPLGTETPESSEQVLHPERYTRADRDVPTGIELAPPPAGWRRFHSDGLGEFEIRVFLEMFTADSGRARAGAEGWDGDRYELLRGESGEALLWASVWDGPEEADEFAAVAREAFRRRYAREDAVARTVEIARARISGRPGVVVADVPAGVDPDPLRAASRIRAEDGG